MASLLRLYFSKKKPLPGDGNGFKLDLFSGTDHHPAPIQQGIIIPIIIEICTRPILVFSFFINPSIKYGSSITGRLDLVKRIF